MTLLQVIIASIDLLVALIIGLTNITHSAETAVSIVPFPPGHFEVFDLKLNGKVQSLQMEQFHCCTQEPAHAKYDSVERLPTGKEMPTSL